MEQQTIIFLGPQGSGKGTQVQLIKDYFAAHDSRPIVHFEAGAALRKFGEQGGYTSSLVDASLKRGELQPDFITLELMSQMFISSLKGDEHLMVDGFPRTREQQAIFHGAMQFYKRANPTLIFLNISDEEAVKRLLKRGRSDDTEEGIRKRLAWTRSQVEPAVVWFRENFAYRSFEINGERSVEEIHQDILEKLGLQ